MVNQKLKFAGVKEESVGSRAITLLGIPLNSCVPQLDCNPANHSKNMFGVPPSTKLQNPQSERVSAVSEPKQDAKVLLLQPMLCWRTKAGRPSESVSHWFRRAEVGNLRSMHKPHVTCPSSTQLNPAVWPLAATSVAISTSTTPEVDARKVLQPAAYWTSSSKFELVYVVAIMIHNVHVWVQLWTKRGWLKYDQTLTDDRMRRPRKAMHIITALILLKWSFRFRCPTCRGSLLYILQDPHAFTWPNSIQVKREREMIFFASSHDTICIGALPYPLEQTVAPSNNFISGSVSATALALQPWSRSPWRNSVFFPRKSWKFWESLGVILSPNNQTEKTGLILPAIPSVPWAYGCMNFLDTSTISAQTVKPMPAPCTSLLSNDKVFKNSKGWQFYVCVYRMRVFCNHSIGWISRIGCFSWPLAAPAAV